ncbi:MFS transporter [Steroidobacter flavus]|uniref:MFS transporter n=1 Tax=Steroidobacter flavus TaxID=1842136 RepID=A0ABV8T537_9GAMM
MSKEPDAAVRAASPPSAAAADSSALSEWREHWPMVIAAMAGLSFATVAVYSMGLFMEPLSHEFGWTRAQMSLGLSIVALFAVPLSPFAGALIDRWGSRRLGIPGIILSAIAFAGFSLATGSLTQWYVLWVCYAIVAIAIKTTVWTAAVSSVFQSSRALALAVVLSGAAISQTITPLIAQWLIDGYGWRQAFLWMGLGWGSVVLILLLPFFFDARDHERRTPSASNNRAALSGLTLAEGIRDPALLRIAAALFITSFLGVAVTVHKVPILTQTGLTREVAAQIAASAGIAGITGKLLTGWMMDRWQSGWIGGICLSLPALACLLLLDPIRTPTLIVASMMIFGYSAGAYLQICTYLTTRYGGLRHFGKIFGIMAGLMALATGVGPIVAGALYDHFGNYTVLLLAGIPIGLLSGWLVAGLGPYPTWQPVDIAGCRAVSKPRPD